MGRASREGHSRLIFKDSYRPPGVSDFAIQLYNTVSKVNTRFQNARLTLLGNFNYPGTNRNTLTG